MSGMLDGMNGLSTKSTLLVNRLRKLLFPPACLFCRQSLDSDDQAEGCCATCFEQIHIWPTATCMHCGKPMPDGMAPGPCGSCLSHPPAQSRTLNLYGYAGPVRNAVLEWKLQGHEAGVRWLLKAAMPRLSREIGRDTLLLPVPMPLSRMRKSGQHHAANLCRWLADERDCDWQWQLLRRRGEQPRQSSLSGAARRKNLRHAFHLADGQGVDSSDYRSICIVDDIMTTGATLHYAARACRKLGVPVSVLSLARTSQRR
ncbi:MAG: hypothetical protein CO187_02070 [Zetaproteobacteria bacterium CG_4_9_14_3_um_filter_53_7]|nr:MAG: hypothetical protein CO187_02070 [Zetaproteobacteria bacterium CG_4_9_14_3_um_filter_53_7]